MSHWVDAMFGGEFSLDAHGVSPSFRILVIDHAIIYLNDWLLYWLLYQQSMKRRTSELTVALTAQHPMTTHHPRSVRSSKTPIASHSPLDRIVDSK